jgi:hypothetical protein
MVVAGAGIAGTQFMGDVVHGDNHAKAFFENPLHSIHGRRTRESSDSARSNRKAY